MAVMFGLICHALVYLDAMWNRSWKVASYDSKSVMKAQGPRASSAHRISDNYYDKVYYMY